MTPTDTRTLGDWLDDLPEHARLHTRRHRGIVLVSDTVMTWAAPAADFDAALATEVPAGEVTDADGLRPSDVLAYNMLCELVPALGPYAPGVREACEACDVRALFDGARTHDMGPLDPRWVNERMATPLERIDIHEDNAGGLYLHLVGPGVVVDGVAEDGTALADCRLIRAWIEDAAFDGHCWPAEAIGEARLVAVYDHNDEITTHEPMGYAARRYIFGA